METEPPRVESAAVRVLRAIGHAPRYAALGCIRLYQKTAPIGRQCAGISRHVPNTRRERF